MAEPDLLSDKLKLLVNQRHLRRPAVEAATGLSRSSIYDMMAKGKFPRPIRIGKRAVAWPESAISDWLANCPNSQGAAG